MPAPRSVLLLLLLLVGLPGCSDPVASDGLCLTAVNVGGVLFTLAEGDAPAAAAVVQEPLVTVTRNSGCLDQGEADVELAPGESNFLPVGTTIHRITGYDADERLAVLYGVSGGWQALAPLD